MLQPSESQSLGTAWPTTTGYRILITDGTHEANSHLSVRPWSEIYEPDPARPNFGLQATPIDTLSRSAVIFDIHRSVGVFGPATFR